VLQQLGVPEDATRAFHYDLLRRHTVIPTEGINIPSSSIIYHSDKGDNAEVTVVVPLYNYAHFIEEALDSVLSQTTPTLDLIVVDDASDDTSLQVATTWARGHVDRFNRIIVVRNDANSGLARTRNVGFDLAETPFILPLDADNRLLPDCCDKLANALRSSRAGFSYPILQCFGNADHVIGTESFSPVRFAGGNYIDALAMISKWCWVKVGGYTHIRFGWEDYDFWCKCVEHGVWGEHVCEILAEYRVHEASMLRSCTDRPPMKREVISRLEERHKELTVPDQS
jgi:glycosyltransferase involved in cell wall biosynthesis